MTKMVKWNFSGSLMQGIKSNLSFEMSEGKRSAVDKHAKGIAQSTVSYSLSDLQTRHIYY